MAKKNRGNQKSKQAKLKIQHVNTRRPSKGNDEQKTKVDAEEMKIKKRLFWKRRRNRNRIMESDYTAESITVLKGLGGSQKTPRNVYRGHRTARTASPCL